MTKITGFWNEHKVFLIGLVTSVAMALQQFVSTSDKPDYRVIAFAVLIAVLSYLAKSWRGQTTSIVGFIGLAAGTFVTEWQNPHGFTWLQFAIQLIMAWLATQTPDAKSRGYELSDPIVEAKKEGEKILPAPLTSVPKK